MNAFTKTITEATGYNVESMSKFDFPLYLKQLEFKKGDSIPRLNLSADYFSIITEGTLFLYWKIDQKNNTIIDFKRKGEVLRPAFDIDKHIYNKIYAKCLTPVTLTCIKRDQMCSISREDQNIYDLYSGLLTADLGATHRQLRMLKEENIEKRYLIFKDEFADIFNLISDRMIANYLGVHYTTLARMKVRLLKK